MVRGGGGDGGGGGGWRVTKPLAIGKSFFFFIYSIVSGMNEVFFLFH